MLDVQGEIDKLTQVIRDALEKDDLKRAKKAMQMREMVIDQWHVMQSLKERLAKSK